MENDPNEEPQRSVEPAEVASVDTDTKNRSEAVQPEISNVVPPTKTPVEPAAESGKTSDIKESKTESRLNRTDFGKGAQYEFVTTLPLNVILQKEENGVSSIIMINRWFLYYMYRS